ncbi:MAG: alanine racemase [Muribaculaceae bacterium]|nr:alanine racemase [Muribaculaceae bacterium]
MTYNSKDLADDLGAAFSGGAPHTEEVSIPLTDSRSLLFPAKSIFFALKTDTNDGSRYLTDLYQRGVRNFVVNFNATDQLLLHDDVNLIVPRHGDTLGLLHSSAAFIRSGVNCPVVGVTGSRGKTVFKEMLAQATAPENIIVKSPRSWNSQIGVPLAVWRLTDDTTLGIFEAGISRPGEMYTLQRIIRPTIGVFTCLTDEHGLGFDSMEQKAREKALLFTECPVVIYPGGLNRSSQIIEKVLREVAPKTRLIPVKDATMEYMVAQTMIELGYDPEIAVERTGHLREVNTRIDINEGMDNTIIAYDHYSNTLEGVETAIDIVSRRCSETRPIMLVTGPLQIENMNPKGSYKALNDLLLARRAKGVIFIGEELKEYDSVFSPSLVREYMPDVESFNRKFSLGDFSDSAILIKGGGNQEFVKIKDSLEFTRHDSYMEVNLDNLTHNFNYYRSLVRPDTALCAMVKADAYGAGAVEVASALQGKADYLAVAVAEEGITLRNAGITTPVIILNPISSNYREIFDKSLEPTVFDIPELSLLASHLPPETYAYPIHIKLDTGMHRFGFTEDQLEGLVERLNAMPQFKVASIFSHLATADCMDQDDYTLYQLRQFEKMSSFIAGRLPYKVRRHILNTAGMMRFPRYQYDMVRLGIGLYGIEPSQSMACGALKPVSSLYTRISSVRALNGGDTVGYGRKGVIERPTVIATLPIGYADGIDRHLGCGRALFYVEGVPCPTVGNICMDLCMIDISGLREPLMAVGSKVEIFGSLNPVTNLSNRLDTIPYEILVSISPRVKRQYYRE